jgi:hypothetical protein
VQAGYVGEDVESILYKLLMVIQLFLELDVSLTFFLKYAQDTVWICAGIFWSCRSLYIDTDANFIIVDLIWCLFLHHVFRMVSLVIFKIIYWTIKPQF